MTCSCWAPLSGSVIGFLRYLQLKNRLCRPWLNVAGLAFFSIACFGMTIVGNFQVNVAPDGNGVPPWPPLSDWLTDWLMFAALCSDEDSWLRHPDDVRDGHAVLLASSLHHAEGEPEGRGDEGRRPPFPVGWTHHSMLDIEVRYPLRNKSCKSFDKHFLTCERDKVQFYTPCGAFSSIPIFERLRIILFQLSTNCNY